MSKLWNRGFSITWLGHSAFEVITPGGKVLLLDPWVTGNPKTPEDRRVLTKADVIVVSHAHGDHVSDVPEIAKRTGAKVVCGFEVGEHLESKGVTTASGMGMGGTQRVDGLAFTMVNAVHSSSFDEPGRPHGGGEGGFVITLEDGTVLYFAGDTGPTMDMHITRELYAPEIAFLPIGDHWTMGPREAAWACATLGVKYVLPMHWGTFGLLTGTPEALRAELAKRGCAAQVVDMTPGVAVS
ncbi:MAG: metal-dependent hydrolase [Candidatus Eisenbacteria bacterium]